jgi:hypothetical protein
MAAGEYVSVSSQADTEAADLTREKQELATQPAEEHAELTAIYTKRGLDESLAAEVATQLMAKDALTAHGRDELGITEELSARPVQAAFASAGTFTVGAALPLLLVLMLPKAWLVWGVSAASLAFLALLGSLAARAGGSPVWKSSARVTFWGGRWRWGWRRASARSSALAYRAAQSRGAGPQESFGGRSLLRFGWARGGVQHEKLSHRLRTAFTGEGRADAIHTGVAARVV